MIDLFSIAAGVVEYLQAAIVALTVLLICVCLLLMRTLQSAGKRTLNESKSGGRLPGGNLYIVAGDGGTADNITAQVYKCGATLRLGRSAKTTRLKGVTYRNLSLDTATLQNLRFTSRKERLVLYCAYEHDGDNLTAALLLKSFLADKAEDCGERRVIIMYKNLGKTQFFKFATSEISFFNPDELTATRFLEQYPIASYRSKDEEKNDIVRLFVGFSDTNSEILEKLMLTDSLPEYSLKAAVFDKRADELLPVFYTRSNDVCERDLISYTEAENNAKIAAFKIDAESYELYEKITSYCQNEDYCAVYIDLGEPLLSIETAVELRDELAKNDLSEKCVIFVKNDSDDFISNCSVLNEGFTPPFDIIFYGAFKDTFELIKV